MTPPHGLVVAKAPVPGEAKTRLGAVVGMRAAAELAAAALLDTLDACAAAFGPERTYVALAGDLARAASRDEIAHQLRRSVVFEQEGDRFAERLVHAHAEVARRAGSPTVQIGMDTPQVTEALLRAVTAGLDDGDAVLGDAEDGGWWVLALADPEAAAAIVDVPTSVPDTGARTRAALRAQGLRVGEAPRLRDVDTVGDAWVVAARAPGSRFAETWARVQRRAS